MEEYEVVIPEEQHGGFDFTQDEMPGMAVVNVALDGFEPKLVFAWHLSMLVDYKDLDDDEYPSPAEEEILGEFETSLDQQLKEDDNALFLARVSHAGQRELVWRIYDPKVAHEQLQSILSNKSHPRPFEYKIDHDEQWAETEWFLDNSRIVS